MKEALALFSLHDMELRLAHLRTIQWFFRASSFFMTGLQECLL